MNELSVKVEDRENDSVLLCPVCGDSYMYFGNSRRLTDGGEVALDFKCEALEHTATLVIYFHKGQTLMEWRNIANNEPAQ